MIDEAVSKNGVVIRLTDERWAHITEEHCELAGLRSEVLETVLLPGADTRRWRRRTDRNTEDET